MTGIICLNKPEGITSFSAVEKVRRITGEKKAGHTGTLDPMATGVLPVMLGGATRFYEILPTSTKGYRAKFRLGITTDTLDITGRILTENEVNVGFDEVNCALNRFKGEIMQIPPMYSAISKDGVRLYELARQGIEIEREERPVTIYKLELITQRENSDEYEIEVECSAGTYIRTLISDIGQALSCGATMTELCRIKSNGFLIEDSFTLEELVELAMKSELNSCLKSVEKVLADYESVSVSPAQAIRFSNGGSLDLQRIKCSNSQGYYRIYSPDNLFLGIGEILTDCYEMKVKRIYTEK